MQTAAGTRTLVLLGLVHSARLALDWSDARNQAESALVKSWVWRPLITRRPRRATPFIASLVAPDVLKIPRANRCRGPRSSRDCPEPALASRQGYFARAGRFFADCGRIVRCSYIARPPERKSRSSASWSGE
jgi:hypothetical protein